MKNPEFERLRDTWVVKDTIRRTMQANRRSHTRPEQSLKVALVESGIIPFEENVSDLPGSPDIVFREARLAVLVHGCFWHDCPLCGRQRLPATNTNYWRTKFERNKVRDRETDKLLAELGYYVMKVWECELKRDLVSITESIRSVHDHLSRTFQ